MGEHGEHIVDLAELRDNSGPKATPAGLFLEVPLKPLREGEARITSDYTGTAEAAILRLPGIWLIRGGRHYRSFCCWGPDGAGKPIKEWNVIEQSVDTGGSLPWKPIHRVVSDLTNRELRLKEIDAQLRVLGVPRHPSAVAAVPAFFI